MDGKSKKCQKSISVAIFRDMGPTESLCFWVGSQRLQLSGAAAATWNSCFMRQQLFFDPNQVPLVSFSPSQLPFSRLAYLLQ